MEHNITKYWLNFIIVLRILRPESPENTLMEEQQRWDEEFGVGVWEGLSWWAIMLAPLSMWSSGYFQAVEIRTGLTLEFADIGKYCVTIIISPLLITWGLRQSCTVAVVCRHGGWYLPVIEGQRVRAAPLPSIFIGQTPKWQIMESNPDVWECGQTVFHQRGHKDNFTISEQKCQVSWEMLLAVDLCISPGLWFQNQ